MGTRRYCTEIAAPLSQRFKMRLERAVTQAIRNPTRALPTLRRAVMSATVELRAQGLTDEHIRSLFARLIEDVAHEQSLDATSIVSGHPRWLELTTRVGTWMQSAAASSD
jgi:hypothetical protein